MTIPSIRGVIVICSMGSDVRIVRWLGIVASCHWSQLENHCPVGPEGSNQECRRLVMTPATPADETTVENDARWCKTIHRTFIIHHQHQETLMNHPWHHGFGWEFWVLVSNPYSDAVLCRCFDGQSRSEWSDISEGFMTGACRRDGKLDGLMDEGALDHPLDRDHWDHWDTDRYCMVLHHILGVTWSKKKWPVVTASVVDLWWISGQLLPSGQSSSILTWSPGVWDVDQGGMLVVHLHWWKHTGSITKGYQRYVMKIPIKHKSISRVVLNLFAGTAWERQICTKAVGISRPENRKRSSWSFDGLCLIAMVSSRGKGNIQLWQRCSATLCCDCCNCY